MPNSPLVSIVVPIYKAEPYLDDCLSSITSQSHQNIEVILVNDGSPDRCAEICDKHAEADNRIKVIHQANQGVSSARNSGLTAATGQYVTLVDADDTIQANMVEKMVGIAQGEGADIVSCGISRTGSAHSRHPRPDATWAKAGRKILQEFLENKTDQSACARLYDADLIRNIRFDPDINVNEDKLYIYSAFSRASLHVSTELPLYNYHQVEDSVSHSEFSEIVFDIEKVADLIFGDVMRTAPDLQKYANVQLIRSLMELYTHMTLSNDARTLYAQDYRRLRNRIIEKGFRQLDTKLATLRLFVIIYGSSLYVPLAFLYARVFRRPRR